MQKQRTSSIMNFVGSPLLASLIAQTFDGYASEVTRANSLSRLERERIRDAPLSFRLCGADTAEIVVAAESHI
jgi:hypothetical protein